MEKYKRKTEIEAEPMNEFDFLLAHPGKPSLAGVIGPRPAGSRAGYRVVEPDGAVSWIEKSVFERDYRKI